MAKSGATKDYKFGPKNNWRRTIWNDVLRRTGGREKTQPILYLAGPEDIDRQIARSKGVPHQNLIAIDVSAENVNAVRSSKAPAIQASAADVLASWPEDRPVCAVLLDFCAGLTIDAIDVYDLFECKPLREAVVMVNMMRGRDAWSNQIRGYLSAADEDDETTLAADIATAQYGPSGPPGFLSAGTKHRALLMLLAHAIDTVAAVTRGSFKRALVLPELGVNPQADAMVLELSSRVFATMQPSLYTYKSGALSFDSAVFRHFTHRLSSRTSEEMMRMVDAEVQENHGGAKVPAVARKIAATLAVRTTRLAAMA